MKSRLLIYDDHCPLCAWYSNLFVKYGLLKPGERKPFSKLDDETFAKIDFEKAKDEIPFIDKNNGRVLYGIDALVAILSVKMPFIRKVAAFQPVNWLLRRLYKLISYNRKVIVAKKCGKGDIDCTPSFNYLYRILFMILFLLFNSLMLYPIHNYVLTEVAVYSKTIQQILIAHFTLVAVNIVLACTLPFNKALEYLGQVNMLALEAILFLLLLIPIVQIFSPHIIFLSVYFFALTVFIVYEYLRRMEYAGIIAGNRWMAAINIASFSLIILYLIS